LFEIYKIKNWNSFTTELKERIGERHPILRIFNDKMNKGSICFQDLAPAKLLWVYVVQHRRFSDVFRAMIVQKNGLQKVFGLIKTR